MKKLLALSLLALAAAHRAGAGNQGRHRHLRLDRLRAADAGQGSRHLQEERPGRDASRRSRRRTATWPSPRATSSAPPPRWRPGSSGTPTAWPPRRSSSWTRATAPTAWWSSPTSRRSRPEGQDRRRQRAGHRALLHPGLDAEEERPVDQGREGRQPRAAGRRQRHDRRHRRPRRRHDLRALPVGGARQARGRQDHRHHARLPDGDGHLRLHAQVPGREPEGRARRWPTATSRRSR